MECLKILLDLEALLLMRFVGDVFALHSRMLSVISSHYGMLVSGSRECRPSRANGGLAPVISDNDRSIERRQQSLACKMEVLSS